MAQSRGGLLVRGVVSTQHRWNRLCPNLLDRQRLTQRMTTTTENLSDSARLIDVALELLENPQQ